MIIFIWSLMTFTVSPQDYYQDDSVESENNIRLIVDIPAGKSYACMCPSGCDDSECSFVQTPAGAICTGQCSPGEGYVDCDYFGEQSTTYTQDTEITENQYYDPCMSNCIVEEKNHSAIDYEPWMDSVLGR